MLYKQASYRSTILHQVYSYYKGLVCPYSSGKSLNDASHVNVIESLELYMDVLIVTQAVSLQPTVHLTLPIIITMIPNPTPKLTSP